MLYRPLYTTTIHDGSFAGQGPFSKAACCKCVCCREASFTVAFHKERLSGLTAAHPTLEASGTAWVQVPKMATTSGKLIHNLRSHPSECWTMTPKALRMTWAVPAKLHTPSITSAAFHPPHRRVNYWLARKQAPRLLPGAGRPGHSLLITAVVISDSNWQHRELNYHPLREACSMRQTRGLLSCLCCRAIINFKLISLVSLKWLLKI